MSGELLRGADFGLSWKAEYQAGRNGADQSNVALSMGRGAQSGKGTCGLWERERLDVRSMLHNSWPLQSLWLVEGVTSGCALQVDIWVIYHLLP